MMQLVLIVATVGSTTAASCKGLGVPHEHPPVTGPSASRSLLPGSLEVVSLAVQFPAYLFVMWALTLCFEYVPLPFSIGAILSPKLLL